VRERLVDAATDLVRERSFDELSVAEVTGRAGIERTIFYRHFDDLSDLLLRAATEAIESLYDAQVELDADREEGDLETVRAAIEPAVRVYQRHGPVLRAVTEAGASNPQIAARGAELRRRFNELVAGSLARLPGLRENPPADVAESARALNLLNEAYLRDAFGHEPRVSAEAAIQTLTEIWAAFLDRRAPRTGRD
jgi:AcrR family transcriptional regulator